jgi:CO/xanthine dehydrogenase FAD-binding subunit
MPLAGGTDLLVQIKEGSRSADVLLSLRRVPEVHRFLCDKALTLGSAVTLGKIAAEQHILGYYTALAMGAKVIGSEQIRNMATIGGNICNAAPSADTAPPLLVLGAQAMIASSRGERSIPIDAFFAGPGRTVLQSGELLSEIVIPRPPDRTGSFYIRHTSRAQMDIAVVGVAAALTLDRDDKIADARISLGAVAPVPMRSIAAEQLLRGQCLTDDVLQSAGETAALEAKPIDDVRASADYRRHLVKVLTRRALRGAFARANERTR